MTKGKKPAAIVSRAWKKLIPVVWPPSLGIKGGRRAGICGKSIHHRTEAGLSRVVSETPPDCMQRNPLQIAAWRKGLGVAASFGSERA